MDCVSKIVVNRLNSIEYNLLISSAIWIKIENRGNTDVSVRFSGGVYPLESSGNRCDTIIIPCNLDNGIVNESLQVKNGTPGSDIDVVVIYLQKLEKDD